MNPTQIIAVLNALHVGEMDAIQLKLAEAREACVQLQQSLLADHLAEAGRALGRADMKTYRKRIETVIAQLGHLK